MKRLTPVVSALVLSSCHPKNTTKPPEPPFDPAARPTAELHSTWEELAGERLPEEYRFKWRPGLDGKAHARAEEAVHKLTSVLRHRFHDVSGVLATVDGRPAVIAGERAILGREIAEMTTTHWDTAPAWVDKYVETHERFATCLLSEVADKCLTALKEKLSSSPPAE